jgi:hypothetical protein
MQENLGVNEREVAICDFFHKIAGHPQTISWESVAAFHNAARYQAGLPCASVACPVLATTRHEIC